MRKAYILFISILFIPLAGFNQFSFMIEGAAGPNFIFDRSATNLIGFSVHGGIGVSLGDEDRMQFRPLISATASSYRSEADQFGNFVEERADIGLDLPVSISLGSSFDLYTGLFGQIMVGQSTAYTVHHGNGTTSIGTTAIQSDPRRFQAGVFLGAHYWFGKEKFLGINLQCRQHATSIMKSDYLYNDESGIPQVRFSSYSLPTTFLLGMTVRLRT